MAHANSLSDLQLAIMRVVWSRGEATVNDVHTALQVSRGLALSTVATMMNRLIKDEVLDRDRRERTYVYRALVSESEVTRSAVNSLLSRLFGGDPQRLVSHLMAEGDVSPDELAEARALLAEEASND